MVSLLQIYNAITLQGRVELQQISRQFNAPPALVAAMLQQLQHAGKITQVVEYGGCVSRCSSCPLSQRQCARTFYALSVSAPHLHGSNRQVD